MSILKLNIIPGFSDLPDSVLDAEDPAFGLHAAQISLNAAFGMVRLEVFWGIYKNKDVVPLPVSSTDDYTYSRNELMYFWTVRNTVDPASNWISGPDALWFCNWDVNQDTGEVFSEEWYERSDTSDSWAPAQSNDGSLLVFAIGQRERTSIMMASPATFTAIDETTIATDKPLTEELIQRLNDDAKFSVVGTEVFYLGEYVDGNTVTMPTSPVDGHAYSAAECKFLPAWRWTTSSGSYTQPPKGAGWGCDQLGPIQASVNGSGVCSVEVTFSTNGGVDATAPSPHFGRIAVFAFCTRSATPATISPEAASFTEIDPSKLFPGNDLRASEVLTIKRNIDEALLTPEFFGPTDYVNGDTVPCPTSAIDGHVYLRSELKYIPTWKFAGFQTPGTHSGDHCRTEMFSGMVDQSTGAVSVLAYRAPPGGPHVEQDGDCILTVITVGMRQLAPPAVAVVGTSATNVPANAATTTIDTSIIQVNEV